MSEPTTDQWLARYHEDMGNDLAGILALDAGLRAVFEAASPRPRGENRDSPVTEDPGASWAELPQTLVPLSRSERQVWALLQQDMAIAQIARALFISESTAKTHVANIFEKLRTQNRDQSSIDDLRRRPRRSGPIPPGPPDQ